MTCVWGDEEGRGVEEGGSSEDGGSEFAAVVGKVCRLQCVLSDLTHKISSLRRMNEVNDRQIEHTDVKNTYSTLASRKYNKQNEVNRGSVDTSKVC